MKKTWRILSMFILISSILFLPGCWSRKEIEDLAVVTMIGLDRITEQGVDKWLMTAKIMQPKGVGKQGGGNSGATPEGGKELLLSGTGITMQEAARNLMLRSPRFLFMGFLSSTVIGEKVAQEGVRDISQVRGRYREFRLRTYIMIAQGQAFDVLQACPEVSETLSEEVEGLAEHKAQRIGVSCNMDWNNFAQLMLGPDRDPVAPRVRIIYPKEDPIKHVNQAAVLQGIALFRGDKLAGWFNEEESLGYILSAGNQSNAQIPVPLVEGDKKITFLLGKYRSKIQPVVEDGKVSFRLNIKAWGEIDEVSGLKLDEAELPQIEELASARIKDLALKAIAKSQESGADVIGFSQALHRTNLAAWQEYGKAWRDNFGRADVEVEVQAKVARVGKIGKAIEYKD